jgi:hypothetical protein
MNRSVYIGRNDQSLSAALDGVSVAVIGAHQDDLPILHPAIGMDGSHVLGVVVTDGAGSPSTKGDYSRSAGFTESKIAALRHAEQHAEAAVGKYAVQAQLGYSSEDIGGRGNTGAGPQQEALTLELLQFFTKATNLKEVYVHTPFDKHQTHNAVTRAVIEALRMLPPERRNAITLIGREVWRDMDWLPENKKHLTDVTPALGSVQRLLQQHRTQNTLKSYDTGAVGRFLANSTFGDSHAASDASAVAVGVDMTELLKNPQMTLVDFCDEAAKAFRKSLMQRAAMFEPAARERPNKLSEINIPLVYAHPEVDIILPKVVQHIHRWIDITEQIEMSKLYAFVQKAVQLSGKRAAPSIASRPEYKTLMSAMVTPEGESPGDAQKALVLQRIERAVDYQLACLRGETPKP